LSVNTLESAILDQLKATTVSLHTTLTTTDMNLAVCDGLVRIDENVLTEDPKVFGNRPGNTPS
jgi:hypothetical protein